MRVGLAVVGIAVLLAAGSTGRAQEEDFAMVIEEGSRVSIEYTLKLDDGSTADSNVGGDPLVYQQGQGQILPALERSLAGLQADARKQVTLKPEQGYGEVDPQAFQTVPTDAIPEDARKAGAQLLARSRDGDQRLVRVHEVKQEQIVLDLNHPLAGETLHFDILVLGIE